MLNLFRPVPDAVISLEYYKTDRNYLWPLAQYQ